MNSFRYRYRGSNDLGELLSWEGRPRVWRSVVRVRSGRSDETHPDGGKDAETGVWGGLGGIYQAGAVPTDPVRILNYIVLHEGVKILRFGNSNLMVPEVHETRSRYLHVLFELTTGKLWFPLCLEVRA